MIYKKPLIVDLDGTLIFSDMLFETFVRLIKKNPLILFFVPLWLLRGGKSRLKYEVARRIAFDASTLPYNQPLIEYLQDQQRYRDVFLATASHSLVAESICKQFDFFSGCFASDSAKNLKGKTKADLLNEKFGEGQYSYVGNDQNDLEVWKHSHSALVVTNSENLIKKASGVTQIEKKFSSPRGYVASFVKAMRVHQWVKNALLFVPIFTAHQYTQFNLMLDVVLAMLAFSLCASSVYLLNDLMDIEADRLHKSKRNRPFASGRLPIVYGLLGFPVLLASALFICLKLPVSFLLVLVTYFVATTAYSFFFKQKLLVDVIFLAGLFTCRIMAGAAATSIALSEWLLAFAMFFFLSLALVKRYTELVYLSSAGETNSKGRGYLVIDMPLISAMGVASGYISVLVFALYLNTDVVSELYSTPTLLWMLGPILLYWISRVWILAHRGEMNDDPIVFAIRDRVSQIMGLLIALAFLIAQ